MENKLKSLTLAAIFMVSAGVLTGCKSTQSKVTYSNPVCAKLDSMKIRYSRDLKTQALGNAFALALGDASGVHKQQTRNQGRNDRLRDKIDRIDLKMIKRGCFK